MRKWLNDNSTNDLFSSSSSTDNCSMIVVITDDEEEKKDKSDVIIINSSNSSSSGEDMTMTMRHIDKIIDRSESMVSEQRFNVAVESAAVRYACDEVNRVMNLNSDDDYTPSSDTIMHLLRWLTIEVLTTCGTAKWRERVTDKVRDVLIEQYMHRMN